MPWRRCTIVVAGRRGRDGALQILQARGLGFVARAWYGCGVRWFWFLWAFDAVIAAVFVFFFFWGLSDGTVSSFNGALWAQILIGLAAVLGGGLALRASGRERVAMALLAVLALPGLLALMFFVVVMLSNPRWN